jgi:hippurate hydrolase
MGIDPIAIAVQLYTALQTIVARNVDPIKSAVISITMFHAGSARNVIAQTAEMSASIRSFDPEIRTLIERRVRELCAGMEVMHGVKIDLEYSRGYPPTINHETEVRDAITIAREVVGDTLVDDDIAPIMGSEDFSYMLEARPGAFLWIGGGKTDNDPGLHHPEYDFNDDLLTLGASYWSKLVETRMARDG